MRIIGHRGARNIWAENSLSGFRNVCALGVDAALYCAVCKDDDRLFFERVKYDEKIATYYMDRARRIIQSDRMPEPINGASPEWFQCKRCGYSCK